MANAVAQAYSGCLGLGQSPGAKFAPDQGIGPKSPEAKSNLKLKEQYCALDLTIFDLLVLSYISSIAAYLLYTHAANAKTQWVVK